VNARNRVFLILGLLTVGSLIWYLVTVRPSADLQLIGTVDANEVVVSSKIPGRIQTLFVDEGQDVKAGQLIAVIESDDLAAARKAAEANASSQNGKLGETVETERQTRGETTSATVNAEALVKAARASLAQAQANYDHQQADTTRTVALAQQGIMSEQAKDDAATSLQAAKAAVDAARENVAAAEASLRQARAHELLTAVAAHTVDSTRDAVVNARALAEQAKVQQGYAQVFARSAARSTSAPRDRARSSPQAQPSSPSWTWLSPGFTRRCLRLRPTPCNLAIRCASSCPAARRFRARSSTKPPRPTSPRSAMSAHANATSKPFSSSCSSTILASASFPA